MQPKISDTELQRVKDTLVEIRKDILKLKMTFEEAVNSYSEDKDTKSNKGLLVNPQTSDTKFDLTRMDPSLYARISTLKEGEISDVSMMKPGKGKKCIRSFWSRRKHRPTKQICLKIM